MDATRSSAEPSRSRFAPSITGSAHPGTLLAGLLCWLDARSRGGHVTLRLEDLDHTRMREGQSDRMIEALSWLGLSWDALVVQSQRLGHYEAAVDTLAAAGRVYPCSCSRKDIRQSQRRGPDGGFAYDNRCRGRALPPGGWRESSEPLRVQLDDGYIELIDESGLHLGQDPAAEIGDPIVRRRDGVFAYQLVVVVDDAASAITRVVRGRDLATSTATQVALQRCLSLPTPSYRHHFLLLETQKQKLAKLHASAPYEDLRNHYTGPELCARLARLAGLVDDAQATTPEELVGRFDWERVRDADRLWEG